MESISPETVIMLAPTILAAILSLLEIAGLTAGRAWVHRLGFPWGVQRETVPFEIDESAELPDVRDLDLRMRWVTPSLLGYRYAGSILGFRSGGDGRGAAVFDSSANRQ